MGTGSLTLGHFQLLDRIGRGGMGEVWRGHHPELGLDVAVKFVTGRHAHHAHWRRAFHREISSTSALHHPGIVQIYDFGELDHDFARRSAGRFHPGTPYLVMEYVDGGSLDRLQGDLDWQTTRLLLLQILDALAHAHARDIVHRDLTPGNVLIHLRDGGVPVVKLGDFGLAHVRFEDAPPDDPETAVGTPAYMAPEQFTGDWRDFGPWTDLYALGCIAYELAAGQRAFDQPTYLGLARAHTGQPPQPFSPQFEVPPRFLDWIQRLLVKNPLRRLHRAADAAVLLAKMSFHAPRPDDSLITVMTAASADEATDEAPSRSAERRLLDEPEVRGLLPTLSSLYHRPTQVSAAAVRRLWTDDAPLSPSPVASVTAAASVDWRDVDTVAEPMPMTDAGLSLFGMRAVGLVGREAERDTLWSAMQTVGRERQPRVIILRGPAGIGKSRLAEWLFVRAHELGQSINLRSAHSKMGGPTDGIGDLAASFLQCTGLERAAVRERVTYLMDSLEPDEQNAYDAIAMAELIEPRDAQQPDGAHVRFSSARERYTFFRRLLNRLSDRRPLVVWFDDVQWGADTLRCARAWLDQRHPPLASLLVLTLREEALSDRPVERELIDALADHPRAQTIALDRLDDVHLAELVDRLLPLDEALRHAVVSRSDGNPLFAERLLADLVARQALRSSPKGFRLAPSATVDLPGDLLELWRQRVEAIAAEAADVRAARRALEIAAVLGREVDAREWRRACRLAGVAIDDELVEHAVAGGIARYTFEGWSFAHSLLRETLERQADQAGRLEAHHAACADALIELYGVEHAAAAERLAVHLEACGRDAEALRPLLSAAELERRRGNYDAALDLFERFRRLAESQGLSPGDPRRIEATTIAARAEILDGRLTAGRDRLRSLIEAVGQQRPAVAPVLQYLGLVSHELGDLARSLEYYRQAAQLFEQSETPQSVARCWHGQAEVHRIVGQLDEAEALYERALALFEDSHQGRQMASGLFGLAFVAMDRGELDRAHQHLEAALATNEQTGNRYGIVWCHSALGDLARRREDWADATAHYERALRLSQDISRYDTGVIRCNLGLVWLGEGDWEQALIVLEQAEAELVQAGDNVYVGYLRVARLAALAGLGRWEELGGELDSVEPWLVDSDIADRDLAWPLALASGLAEDDAPADVRDRLVELARRQRHALHAPRGGLGLSESSTSDPDL